MRKITSTLLYVTSSLVPLLLADVTMAQSKTAQRPPDLLISKIRNTRESTLSNILREFRRYAGKDGVLTMEDIDVLDQKNTATSRANFMNGLFRLDLDGDGVVTKTEIELNEKNNILGIRLRSINQQYDMLTKNQNGGIVIEEAYKSVVKSPEIYKRRNTNYINQARKFLTLTPARGDKRIQSKTVWQLTLETFDYFDSDGDGVLRGAELKKSNKEKSRINRSSGRLFGGGNVVDITPGQCSLPQPGPRDIVILAAVKKSRRHSNIMFGKSQIVAGVISLHIEEGDKPVYAIVHVSRPSVLKVTGDKQRLSHLTIVSRTNNAVYDFPKEKVTFETESDCFRSFPKSTSAGAKLAQSVIKGSIGRRVARTVAANMVEQLAFPSIKTSTCSTNLKKQNKKDYQNLCGVPDWVGEKDSATHTAIAFHHPAGAEIFDNSKLISTSNNSSASAGYPAYLGLMKYIRDGSIEEMSGGGYYVKKPIAEFPPMLSGKLATRFLFSKNVKPPALNRTIGSCVESEDESYEGVVNRDVFCRAFNR